MNKTFRLILRLSLLSLPSFASLAHCQEENAGIERFNLVGEVKRGNMSAYSINGQDFEVGQNAEVTGKLEVGSYAQISGTIAENEHKIVDQATVIKQQNIHMDEEATLVGAR